MTLEELAAVRCDLEDFAVDVFESFGWVDQRGVGRGLPGDLLQDGQRKLVEPLAAWPGEEGNRHAMAHFVTSSLWDLSHVRARLEWKVEQAITPTALIIDDFGFLKDVTRRRA
ncbi:transposase (plasmid) [Streptomyces sp. HU2014]|uniref:transposase n=1 Tax=Streptomyces sp. HU2014 TaxID=2939414 RepID=UPI00200ED5D9|nr:transposase [Streptomyces sp. HU2014]UQI49731.1 transposase [Streptomyces sp. HU2014]